MGKRLGRRHSGSGFHTLLLRLLLFLFCFCFRMARSNTSWVGCSGGVFLGREEAREGGLLSGEVHIFDVNSALLRPDIPPTFRRFFTTPKRHIYSIRKTGRLWSPPPPSPTNNPSNSIVKLLPRHSEKFELASDIISAIGLRGIRLPVPRSSPSPNSPQQALLLLGAELPRHLRANESPTHKASSRKKGASDRQAGERKRKAPPCPVCPVLRDGCWVGAASQSQTSAEPADRSEARRSLAAHGRNFRTGAVSQPANLAVCHSSSSAASSFSAPCTYRLRSRQLSCRGCRSWFLKA